MLSPGFRISAACNSEVQLYNKYTLLGPKQEYGISLDNNHSFPLEEQTQHHLTRHLLYTCSSSQSVSPPDTHPAELPQCPLRTCQKCQLLGSSPDLWNQKFPGMRQSVYEESLQGISMQPKFENRCSKVTQGGEGGGMLLYRQTWLPAGFCNFESSTQDLGSQCADSGYGLTFVHHTACNLDQKYSTFLWL